MRPIRRHDYSPRVEMMPLIDVVFLLLTFFIYAVAVMVVVKSSGVSLLSVEGGGEALTQRVVLVELDGQGRVLIDGAVVADDELDGRLRSIAGQPDTPPVVLALQDVAATVDRGPILTRLWAKLTRAGIQNVQMPEFNRGGDRSP